MYFQSHNKGPVFVQSRTSTSSREQWVPVLRPLEHVKARTTATQAQDVVCDFNLHILSSSVQTREAIISDLCELVSALARTQIESQIIAAAALTINMSLLEA